MVILPVTYGNLPGIIQNSILKFYKISGNLLKNLLNYSNFTGNYVIIIIHN